ncbi:uncharacterized protein VNE69_04212 [Vairimorpha necatrix]|uniref:Uncharacterized protein n=1 Tax=Vairimorpha necatrix TaxID=6039 RepID=A0AAX4JBZ6_9MICR
MSDSGESTSSEEHLFLSGILKEIGEVIKCNICTPKNEEELLTSSKLDLTSTTSTNSSRCKSFLGKDKNGFYSSLDQDTVYTSSLKEDNPISQHIIGYSKLLHCVSTHKPNIDHTSTILIDLFYKLFLVEKYILDFLLDPELLSVIDALRGKYNNQKIKKDIILLSQEYYKNNISALNCEQDIESLTFKIYKSIIKSIEEIKDNNNSTQDYNVIQDSNGIQYSNDINGNINMDDMDDIVHEYVLIVLFMRKESNRFHNIYKKVKHTSFSNRLAILFTYNQDCEFTAEYENIKKKSFINIDLLNKHIPNISRLVFLENEDYETWQRGIVYHYDWNDKVKLWMRNRCETSCLLDKSMIEECIKHKRFRDGWIIYKYGNKSIVNEFHKVISLCISALRHTNEEIWTDRIIEIIKAAIKKNDFYICMDLVEDIFYTLGGVSESQRSRIIKHFIKEIRVMENNEEIVTNIIKGINELCKKCINTETCDICVEHANMIYQEWKRNNTGGFFFKSHSKYESEIYENMLDMCDTVEDCDGFKNLCKDLVNNEAKINKGIYKKLQTVHTKTCKDCKHGTCQTLKVKDNQQLLYHLFNGFNL